MAVIELRTLAFRISVLDDGRLWATVNGDGGQEDDAIVLPDDEQFRALQHKLAILRIEPADTQALGQQLFDALLPASLRRVYDGSFGPIASDVRLRLALTFPPEATVFASLPWEYLYDTSRGPLVQRGISIMRILAQASAPPPLSVSPPLRVLLTSAQTDPPVDVRRELTAAKNALQVLGTQVIVQSDPHVTMESLRERLREGYHVWHYVGHGGDGKLFLEDAEGYADPVEANVLAATLADSGVRLVVLSACQGAAVSQNVLQSVAPALVAAGVPAVVAMQFSVTQESTEAFATEFYRALSRGWPIDACVTEGRKALLDLGSGASMDWGIPVVYSRAEDGMLFSVPDAATNPQAAAELRLASMPTDRVPDIANLPAGSRMPLARNPLFVGREADFMALASALREGATVAVTGMSGIGKTSLATEFAHRYGQYFADVYWVRCGDPAAIAFEVAACSGPEGLNLAGWDDHKIDEQVALTKAAWAEALPRLLIFDGCEDEETLAMWRPATGGCKVLVTGVRSNWSAASGVTPVALKELPRADSVALLRKYRPDLPESDSGLAALSEQLGDLPLALRLAGAYLETYRDDPKFGGPAALLAELQNASLLEHQALKGHDAAALGVGKTFALAAGQLDQNDVTDARACALLARAAACAPGAPIPRDLLLAAPARNGLDSLADQAGSLLKSVSSLWGAKATPPADPEKTASRAVGRLVALGLLEQQSGAALSMHRLVAAFAQSARYDAQAPKRLKDELFENIRGQQDSSGFVKPLGVLLPHTVHAAQEALVRQEFDAAEFVNRVGLYYTQVGAYSDARKLFESGLAFLEQIGFGNHPMAVFILGNIATLLRTQGDFNGARPYVERTVAASEKTFGADKPQTAMALNNLGTLLQALGDLPGARAALEKAAAIWQAQIGLHDPAGAGIFDNLGELLRSQGDLAGAKSYLERSVQIYEQTLGPANPQTAAANNNLGLLLADLGDLPGARRLLEQAVHTWEQALGLEHPQVATGLNNLGMLLRTQGDLAGARPLLERALHISETAIGPDTPQTATMLTNLGLVLRDQNELYAAAALFERALAIRERALGSNHPLTGMAANNLGIALQLQGDLIRARSLIERAVDTIEPALGWKHPDTHLVADNLASLLRATGDMAALKAFYDRAITHATEQLGGEHPLTRSLQEERAKLQ